MDGKWWQRNAWSATLSFGVAFVLGLLALGCSGSPTDGGGPKAKYNLQIILEKNLDQGHDLLWVRFRRDDNGIGGGRVVVDGDTITTSPLSGEGTKTYGASRWSHGQRVRVEAIDTSEAFVYRDSVVIPGVFIITNVIPPTRLWQGGSVVVDWSPATGITGYAISVKPRTAGSSARGLAARIDLGENSYTFNREVFENAFVQLVADVYDIQLLAYTPNLLPRPGAAYKPPPNDTPSPIQGESISGAISALVASARDSIVVPQAH